MTEKASRRGRTSAPRSGSVGEAGETRIEEPVVLKLAGLAAREVEGVEMRRSSAAPAIRSVLAGVAGGGDEAGEDLTRGVHAEVGEGEAAIDLTMAVEFGKSIPLVTDAVRRNVIGRVESLLGLRVARVGITVVDVLVGEGGAA